jgi:hypothetical protein
MDQMERYRRYPMRGPVALDLHFRAARQNPPSVHRAAKHILDLLGHVLSGTERPHEERTSQQDALARLKSVNARSVRAYQVIELPRSSQNPSEGTLRLALGLHTHWSWWHRASTYLRTAIDRADERDQLDDSMWSSVFTGP